MTACETGAELVELEQGSTLDDVKAWLLARGLTRVRADSLAAFAVHRARESGIDPAFNLPVYVCWLDLSILRAEIMMLFNGYRIRTVTQLVRRDFDDDRHFSVEAV